MNDGALEAGVGTMGDRASIERMVQNVVDNRLARPGSRRSGPRKGGGWAIREYPNSERRGVQFDVPEADTLPEEVL